MKEIENYCRAKTFLKRLPGKREKVNLIRTAKPKQFFIKNRQLYYKESRLVIVDKDRQVDIIHDIHERSGDTSHSEAMSAHLGRTPTYEKIAARFFWYGIYNDVADYMQNCNRFQRQSSLPPNLKNEMYSVLVSPYVMKQVVLDFCSLPVVDGYHHLIVCIDYFIDKTALTLDTFLYELVCHHGCFEIQINDQGREFVNGVCTCLYELTGVDQRITSAYHPQSNGLVERQNSTIKNALVKVLDAHPEEWSHIIEGVFFCASPKSTFVNKILAIFLINNRDPVLPIDVKFSLVDRKVNETEVFDEETFEAILVSDTRIRGEICN